MDQHRWLFAPEAIHIHDVNGNTLAARTGDLQGWTLNSVAKRILELLEEPRSQHSLCESIRAEFEVNPNECQSAVAHYLKTVRENGFVETLDDPGTNAVMRRRYLDLLKRSVVNLTHPEHKLRLNYLIKNKHENDPVKRARTLRDIRQQQSAEYSKLIHDKSYGYPILSTFGTVITVQDCGPGLIHIAAYWQYAQQWEILAATFLQQISSLNIERSVLTMA